MAIGSVNVATSAKETSEMSSARPVPACAADALDEPTPQPLPAADPSAAVLITEQEVLFGTAAAAPATRNTSRKSSRPRRKNLPKRYEFLERARMAREMDKL
jgi:hypothetical protein